MAVKPREESAPVAPKHSTSNGSPLIIEWEDAPKTFTRRSGVVLEVWGQSGTGRSHFALTAPGPISLLYFQEKLDGIVQKFPSSAIRWKKINGVYRGDSSEILSAARPEMETFEAYFYDAYRWARTVIVDTHNEAWFLERLGEFGAPKPDKGRVDRNYAAINNRWLSMLNTARQEAECNGTNTIFIGQVEEEWKDTADGFGKKTGKLIRASSTAADKVYLKSDISVQTSKRKDRNGETTFSATVKKGWLNPDSEEEELSGSMCNFASVVGYVTETEPSEWMEKR